MCELWRALLETVTVEVVEGGVRLARPAAELGTPESVREVVSERLARSASPTTELLELAATVGTEFELAIVSRSSRLARTSWSSRRRGDRSGIIDGAARPPARVQVHVTSWCAAPSTTA